MLSGYRREGETFQASDSGSNSLCVGSYLSLLCRFYSSTEYFSLPPQCAADWFELGNTSWEGLESAVVDRWEAVQAAVTRLQPGASTRGRSPSAVTLSRALQVGF